MGQAALTTDQIKQALLAYKATGLNKSQAAEQLGLPQNTFRNRITRALAWLKTPEGKEWAQEAHWYLDRGQQESAAPTIQTATLQNQIKQLQRQLRDATEESVTAHQVREFLVGLRDYEPAAPDWTRVERAPKGGHGIPSLMLSDLHWGETVFPEQVFGCNAYNMNIAARRMKRTIETAMHLCHDVLAKPDFPGMVLVLGGDLICGDIHEELKQTAEKPIMPQVLDVADNIHQGIRLLLTEFDNIFIPCVAGNHGRTTRKPQAKHYAETNFDWLVYQLLERFTADVRDRVQFLSPPARDVTFTVAGRRYRLSHGDQFRGGDGVIGPLGPITRGDKKKRSMAMSLPSDSEQYDTLMIGHFHQYRTGEGLIMNGSMKGYDEYALSNNFDYEAPRQALWFTHPKYGINHHMPVLCDEPKKIQKAKETVSW